MPTSKRIGLGNKLWFEYDAIDDFVSVKESEMAEAIEKFQECIEQLQMDCSRKTLVVDSVTSACTDLLHEQLPKEKLGK